MSYMKNYPINLKFKHSYKHWIIYNVMVSFCVHLARLEFPVIQSNTKFASEGIL